MLDLKNKSIAVVGNSPNLIGQAKGKEIDEHDIVVRFNDYSLEYDADYGSKINVWVRASNDMVIETLSEKNLRRHDLIIVRAEHKNNQKSLSLYRSAGYNHAILPIEYEVELSKKLSAIPSTGLLFLYFLKQNNIAFDTYGFSFFNQDDLKKFGTHHYYNARTKIESKGIKLSKHQWQLELSFFKKLMET